MRKYINMERVGSSRAVTVLVKLQSADVTQIIKYVVSHIRLHSVAKTSPTQRLEIRQSLVSQSKPACSHKINCQSAIYIAFKLVIDKSEENAGVHKLTAHQL